MCGVQSRFQYVWDFVQAVYRPAEHQLIEYNPGPGERLGSDMMYYVEIAELMLDFSYRFTNLRLITWTAVNDNIHDDLRSVSLLPKVMGFF